MKHPILAVSAVSICSSLFFGASDASALSGTTARLLEGMTARGELDHVDLARLRSHLPGPLQPEPDMRCWTLPLIEARAFAHGHGARNLPFPPPSIGFVESSSLPLRVHYEFESQLAMAKIVLASAERAWTHQIDELGAYAPFTDDEDGIPEQGLTLYVAPTGMGGGAYTEWLSDVPETSRSDCSCRVVVDSDNFEEDVEEVVYHEFVHATQMATDCAESVSAWENFAVAAEHLRFPDSYYFVSGFLPEFQSYPEYPIDFWTQNESNMQAPLIYYQYGAALFPLYLAERFGAGDASYLTRLWQSFEQDGTVTVLPWAILSDQGNKPDWFEGTRIMLKDQQMTLAEAHVEFGVWRVAVEQRDDGTHFQQAGYFMSPSIQRTHRKVELPAQGQVETHEYGTGYVRFVPNGSQTALRATLEFAPLVLFSAELLLWRSGQPIERIAFQIDGTTGTATTSSLDRVDEVLLVISQTQDLSHDPDDMDYGAVRAVSYLLEGIDVPDAGSEGGADGGVDAPAGDAGGTTDVADGGGPMMLESAGGGCDCSTRRKGSSGMSLFVALALGLAGAWRRRATLTQHGRA